MSLREDYQPLPQDVRLLGNRALSGGVFQYIHGLLDSPFFSRERVRPCNYLIQYPDPLVLPSAGGWSMSQCSSHFAVSGSLPVQ